MMAQTERPLRNATDGRGDTAAARRISVGLLIVGALALPTGLRAQRHTELGDLGSTGVVEHELTRANMYQGRPVQWWKARCPQAGWGLWIDLQSTFDNYLYVVEGGIPGQGTPRLIAQNDDHEGTNAFIELVCNTPGATIWVGAAAYQAQTSLGRYRLELTTANFAAAAVPPPPPPSAPAGTPDAAPWARTSPASPPPATPGAPPAAAAPGAACAGCPFVLVLAFDHNAVLQAEPGSPAQLASLASSSQRRREWRLVPGLAGRGVSFESVNSPGTYLRHSSFRIFLQRNDGSDLFRRDATFEPRRGQGPPGSPLEAWSYVSDNYDDRWLVATNDGFRIMPVAEMPNPRHAIFSLVDPGLQPAAPPPVARATENPPNSVPRTEDRERMVREAQAAAVADQRERERQRQAAEAARVEQERIEASRQFQREGYARAAAAARRVREAEAREAAAAAASANLARGKRTQQSSTAYGGPSSRAVDGSRNGVFNAGSVTHTAPEANAWWVVDLGAEYDIDRIVIYNRTDCCSERLDGFQVFGTNEALRGPEAVQHRTFWSSHTTAPEVMEISVDGSARYVYVMLSGTNPLSLAEVEVYGTPR